MKAYNAFLTPPQYRLDELEKSLAKATSEFREALVKMSITISDAEAELAYGSLSADELSQLYEEGRKIAWPLLGVGKIADIVVKLKRGDMNHYNPMNLTEDDIVKALTLLDRPCHDMNDLCQEGIDYILSSLELGEYAKRSTIRRLFSRSKGWRSRGPSHSNPDFLTHFNSGLEAFWEGRTDGLDELYDEKTHTPSHLVFIVVFNKFLLCAVAQEIHSLILLVNSLSSQGSLTRRRIIFPKFVYPHTVIVKFFRKRTGLGVDICEPLSFGRAKRIRPPDMSQAYFLETSLKSTTHSPILRGAFAVGELMLHFLRSSYAMFGLRAALAEFVVSIPAFLQNTAIFYREYRGVWSTIVIVISLGPTTGASVNGLLYQCSGTILGGLTSMATWYVVDQRVPGVIILSFVVTVFRSSLMKIKANNRRLILLDSRPTTGSSSINHVDHRSRRS